MRLVIILIVLLLISFSAY
ncbi:type I toxin-antitoxin system toxin IbsC [Escherichia coli]